MRKMNGIIAGILTLVGLAAGEARATDFVWPVSGRVTTTYYYRTGGVHGGIDIAGSSWTPIGAARAGYARHITYYHYGYYYSYGKLVVVSHSSGYSTYYAHNIAYGHSGYVSRGTTIAYRGSTGHSTGPHCHFEIRRYGSRLYIPGYVGQYVYKGRAVPRNYPGIY